MLNIHLNRHSSDHKYVFRKQCTLIVVEPILLDIRINLDDLPQKVEEHC